MSRPPILIDVPERLETERLVLRCPLPGDGAAATEAITESLEDLRPWMPWAQEPQSVDKSEEYVRRSRAHFLARDDLPFAFFLRSDGTYVGGAGLLHIDWEVPRFEIGYWCRSSLQGRGYVTETVRALTRLCFETLDAQRVEIRCDSRNERSRRVAERAGFTLEGEIRHDSRAPDGSLRSTLVFGMIADEYTDRYR